MAVLKNRTQLKELIAARQKVSRAEKSSKKRKRWRGLKRRGSGWKKFFIDSALQRRDGFDDHETSA